MAAKNKLMTLEEAIQSLVHDGDTVFLGGFVAGEPYAAAHEIIRQRKRGLTISKAAGLLVVDQLIGAGCVSRVIASYVWNPVPRSANAFRRAVEAGIPHPIEVEEYSLLTLTLAYFAAALDLPFVATKSLLGSDIARHSTFLGERKLKVIDSPFDGEKVLLVPPLRHDVGIVQVQRADREGNAQAWGPLAATKYGINACSRVIVCAEEIVDSEVIRRDPNRTLIPAFKVDAVVEEPWGSHPDYMPGYYDRDWEFSPFYYRATTTVEGMEQFLQEWVYQVKNRREYLQKLGENRLRQLQVGRQESSPVNYGYYPPYRRSENG
jgi:glutaconate CoA-transferase subunit A